MATNESPRRIPASPEPFNVDKAVNELGSPIARVGAEELGQKLDATTFEGLIPEVPLESLGITVRNLGTLWENIQAYKAQYDREMGNGANVLYGSTMLANARAENPNVNPAQYRQFLQGDQFGAGASLLGYQGAETPVFGLAHLVSERVESATPMVLTNDNLRDSVGFVVKAFMYVPLAEEFREVQQSRKQLLIELDQIELPSDTKLARRLEVLSNYGRVENGELLLSIVRKGFSLS